MGKIFYIIGKSSTGKDSIFLRLLENSSLDLKKVVTYTTRPIRNNEENGKEYFFCSEEDKDRFIKDNKVVELRTYNTWHGKWDYFTIDDGQIDLKTGNYLMIGTLESYEDIKAYYSNKTVVPIYIEVEDGIRLKRAIERENNQVNPKYEELCRRFLADQEDFSEEKLKLADINIRFANVDIDSTVDEITKFITEEIE